MRPSALIRTFIAAVILTLSVAAPSQGQDPPVDEWQAVITGQIEAFRHHDSKAALSFAAGLFQESFADPEQFYLTIVNTGYGPIATSRSHSFGKFEMMDADNVVQQVNLIDADQSLYVALYKLGKEAGDWRVLAVELNKQPGVGV